MKASLDQEVSAFAPGRVEILGNHTDYNQGVVLAAAIDRGLLVSGHPRRDRQIVLRSEAWQRQCQVPLDAITPQTAEPWANYPLGVVAEMLAAQFPISGFEAQIRGALPPGAGLSSSAALEVATGRFLMKLFNLEIPALALAKLCQRAENRFVGVQSGLLDQATSIFGQADHLVYLDCQSDEVRRLAFPPGYALLIADSGTQHGLIAGEYNARRRECQQAATALGVSSLREIDETALAAAQASLDPMLFRRAAHVVGENARVFQAITCLEQGDAAGMGVLMNASHESSRVNFENSTRELDRLVATARELPGVLGSRLSGGGFGGSTVSLVEAAVAPEISLELAQRYRLPNGDPTQVYVCRLADGAA